MSSLEEKDHPEYQAYVYTIYNLVKAGSEQAGIGLLQIVENTEALIAGLKRLNANIKTLSEILGHSNTSMTLNRYIHSSLDDKRTLMENFII